MRKCTTDLLESEYEKVLVRQEDMLFGELESVGLHLPCRIVTRNLHFNLEADWQILFVELDQVTWPAGLSIFFICVRYWACSISAEYVFERCPRFWDGKPVCIPRSGFGR